MPSTKTDLDALEARQAQSSAQKRATYDQLIKKKRAEREVTITVPDENGDDQPLTMLFRAIGAKEYDRLLSKHPPSSQQRTEGGTYNIDTFAPALISKVCVEPDMTETEAKDLWVSDDWSRGEVMTLFGNAVELCNKGLDVPFTDNG